MPETTASLTSVFFPQELRAIARANAARDPWAAEVIRKVVEAAAPFAACSDHELWSWMFGNTITRAWMVWSSGYCPACRKGVPMYEWLVDPLADPWKVRCPHCRALFPTNDFHAFYRSGLDEHGVFDPARADRTLLFNAEHPEPSDPLRTFGVDDGEGFEMDGHRWRFIGAYLIYGQWKKAVVAGMQKLAAAYTLTGEARYAHKAAVLLDRVADLYPTFDFAREGNLYEGPGARGYVSTWHDACEETRMLAEAYDQVREAIDGDTDLTDFLAGKARAYGLANPKSSGAEIRRNVEERILRDALANRPKLESNYPRTDIALITFHIVLGWPENREEVLNLLDGVLEKSTAVDGVTGEKGLTGYSSYTISTLGHFLERLARIDAGLLSELFTRHTGLRDTYRFFIDTWFDGQYYPQAGDCGYFAAKTDRYRGLTLSKTLNLTNPTSLPAESMFSFLWRLYQLTGDTAYVKVLYHANDHSIDNLPYDLFAGNQEAIRRQIEEIITREGPEIHLGYLNKEQWHLALLRAGEGQGARCAWIDYDSGGRHGHTDAMNIGLFAHGLDLMPDFGYPPVQFDGWGSQRALWYPMAAAHNTVVVDGRQFLRMWEEPLGGKTTLWADGQGFRAIRVSGPELIEGQQYERTLAMVNINDASSYLVDVFRVVGGTDHAKFQHSHFGRLTTTGLNLQPGDDYGHDTMMRNFHLDPFPASGWSADWAIEDRYHYLPSGADIHLRYTDLTTGARVATAEAWVIAGGEYNTIDEVWIPCLMIRRQSEEAPLTSAFVAVIEPYESTSKIAAIRRLPLTTTNGAPYPDANTAIEIILVDGHRDLLIAADVENPTGLRPSLAVDGCLVQEDWKITVAAEFCHIRRNADGTLNRITLCRGQSVVLEDYRLELEEPTDIIEVRFP